MEFFNHLIGYLIILPPVSFLLNYFMSEWTKTSRPSWKFQVISIVIMAPLLAIIQTWVSWTLPLLVVFGFSLLGYEILKHQKGKK